MGGGGRVSAQGAVHMAAALAGCRKALVGTSLVSRLLKKRPGNLSEFKLLTSAALELAVPIRFQNASRDSCGISLRHKYITV